MASKVRGFRKTLKRLGVFIPPHVTIINVFGDTCVVIDWPSDWMTPAARIIRHAGYYAEVAILNEDTAIGHLMFNLAGTEWQDGLIPENLHGLEIREPDDTQLPLL